MCHTLWLKVWVCVCLSVCVSPFVPQAWAKHYKKHPSDTHWCPSGLQPVDNKVTSAIKWQPATRLVNSCLISANVTTANTSKPLVTTKNTKALLIIATVLKIRSSITPPTTCDNVVCHPEWQTKKKKKAKSLIWWLFCLLRRVEEARTKHLWCTKSRLEWVRRTSRANRRPSTNSKHFKKNAKFQKSTLSLSFVLFFRLAAEGRTVLDSA